MFVLKPLSKDAIPAALNKAERYRLLNEPVEAESICRDILEVEPGHEDALITLLLSLTDQFEQRLSPTMDEARRILSMLDDDYSQAYYNGIIYERRAKVYLSRGGPGSGHVAYDSFRRAMDCYEEAAAIRPPGNDDATLRWNTCARIIMSNQDLVPDLRDTTESMLE